MARKDWELAVARFSLSVPPTESLAFDDRHGIPIAIVRFVDPEGRIRLTSSGAALGGE